MSLSPKDELWLPKVKVSMHWRLLDGPALAQELPLLEVILVTGILQAERN